MILSIDSIDLGMARHVLSDKEALEVMSTRMVDGWKMLPTACPMEGCNMTLLESREGQVYCARCQAEVVTELPCGAVEERRGGESLEERHGGDEASKREETSKLIGDRLLSGWTMLDVECLKCASAPLMRSPLDDAVRCVMCGPEENRGEPNMEGPSGGIQGQEDDDVDDVVDQSSALSKHLLMGWAMLAETCPRCGSPLMRRKDDGAVLCVQPACCRLDQEDSPPHGVGRNVVKEDADSDRSTPRVTKSEVVEDDAATVVFDRMRYLLPQLPDVAVADAIAALARAARPFGMSETNVAAAQAAKDSVRLHLHATKTTLATATEPRLIADLAGRIEALARAALALDGS